MIDWTITLGDFFQAIALITTIIVAWARVNIRMARYEERHNALEERIDRSESLLNKRMAEFEQHLREGLQRIYDRLDGKVDKK